MPLYLASPSALPLGMSYRVLGTACPWWDGKPDLIQTREDVDGLTPAPLKYDNGELVAPHKTCGAEWVECTDAEAKTQLKEAALADYAAKLDAELATVEDVRAVDMVTVSLAIAEKTVAAKPVGKVGG